MILCIDPGVRDAGAALFEKKELTRAWLARGEDWVTTADAVLETLQVPIEVIDVVVIEQMQIYREEHQKGDQNDLIIVAQMAGRVTGFFPDAQVIAYLPRQWKKQVPKKIMTKRIIASLSAEERERVEIPRAKALTHNIYDAVGIGLKYSKRLRV